MPVRLFHWLKGGTGWDTLQGRQDLSVRRWLGSMPETGI